MPSLGNILDSQAETSPGGVHAEPRNVKVVCYDVAIHSNVAFVLPYLTTSIIDGAKASTRTPTVIL